MASKHLEKRRQDLVRALRGMADLELAYVKALEELARDFGKAYEAQQKVIERAVQRWETASDESVYLEFDSPDFFEHDVEGLRTDAEKWIDEAKAI